MTQGWKPLAKPERSEATLASELREFGAPGHVTSQPSKTAEGQVVN
jgi:hypothetical protein